MKRRTTSMTVAVLIVVGSLAAAPAGAQPLGGGPEAAPGGLTATGFLLQGAVAVHTGFMNLGGYGLLSSGLSGDLRVGAMLDALAATIGASFTSGSDEDSFIGMVTFGPNLQVFLWRSPDQTARIYALAAVDFGAIIERHDAPMGADDDETFVAGLDLGFGGCYFLHPNFLVGLEMGSQTDFIGAERTYYASGFFVSLMLGFVAGS